MQYSDKTIRIGGHSKGGNLAVYSAAKSSGEIQERIVAVHNNDGPGFAWDISETPGHKRIASRIHTILPQTSVVGMLMEHEKRYQVVHSTYDGLYQHDGFSWQVLGTQFVHLDDFSREGKLVDETLSSWADSLNTQQREALADALYSVFTASGAKTLSETRRRKEAARSKIFEKRSRNNTRNWWSARSKYNIPAARGACFPCTPQGNGPFGTPRERLCIGRLALEELRGLRNQVPAGCCI